MQAILHSTFFNADIFIGILFLFMGVFIRKFPPRKITTLYGYQSYLATRNQDTWDTANRYAAGFSRLLSYILIPFGIFTGLVFLSQSDLYYYVTVGSAVIAVLMLRGYTERYLYTHFDKEGNRKAID